ncbi:MAG: hypothetical protein L6R42_011179 [Xanthoria sp. 1 TBL-2021]|nr:MAG: hypothetical protein L6R42_011179 [Xanthoria sp. 1 TBL-2021]
MIDPTTITASTRRPDVPHPDAPLSEVHDYLIAFIVDTLYRLENNPLEDAEEQASDYVAKFESDFERQPSTGLNAAGYLYSCSKKRLVRIFSNDDPEPPRVVRRVCNELHLSLLYSKYGKNSSKWRPFLDFGSYCTLLAVVFNLGALFLVNEPTTMLSWSLVLSTVFHLWVKRMFDYWSSKEGLADPKTPEWLKPRPWCVDPEAFEEYFRTHMTAIWLMPVVVLLWKILSLVVFLLSVVLRFVIF